MSGLAGLMSSSGPCFDGWDLEGAGCSRLGGGASHSRRSREVGDICDSYVYRHMGICGKCVYIHVYVTAVTVVIFVCLLFVSSLSSPYYCFVVILFVLLCPIFSFVFLV